MYAIATLANKKAFKDIKLFLYTLELWNENVPTVYIICDSFIKENIKYKGKLVCITGLDKYTNYQRSQMERLPGSSTRTLWEDFMCEKMNLLNIVHETENRVLFCDADICFMGPLPEVPENTDVGLSKHDIHIFDENRYGTYNGGFVFSGNPTIPIQWKEATKTSRYYEQAALETLVKNNNVYFFPTTCNYGWWRLLQGSQSKTDLENQWKLFRNDKNCGIYINDKPLESIHTHFETNDVFIGYFNSFVMNTLNKLLSIKKTKHLLNFINSLRKI